ncbi:SRPBCC family protein [Amycolatopsis sp. H20-H5]|uniref:SRPBCC family protein n=1 Tax=Amycolatopsis sp. H20-H5 TaxID=3046309 RepID=UPI002DB7127A|nr:SRPBCC domain-containing protein [Amycolatopsis sp. H20-H5]MEC3976822.1 SRPBCC domain-containing protein [Amycolatopsis sp. H20-H5]
MTERADDATSIHVDQFLAHPPRKVWRALTEPDLLERWLGMPNDIKPVVGHRFELLARPVPAAGFAGGPVPCEVLVADQEELLSISWGPVWTVTWRLVAEGRGTRLLLSHEGFDPEDEFQQISRRIMGGGWRSHAQRMLERLLDALED